MTINVAIDEHLLDQAGKRTGQASHEKLVEQALEELNRRRSKLEALLDLAGKVQFYEGYDHKALREGRNDGNS